jgi:hypothetical protein
VLVRHAPCAKYVLKLALDLLGENSHCSKPPAAG